MVPLLHRQLVPHLNGMTDTAENPLGHISLVQGESKFLLFYLLHIHVPFSYDYIQYIHACTLYMYVCIIIIMYMCIA